MRKQTLLAVLAVAAMALSGASQAASIDRGGGLIYDDVLDVTWLQDANYAQTSGYDADGRMNWSAANNWAAGLSYGGYNDWRLADVAPVDNTAFDYGFSYDGSTDRGFNITSTQSELAYMFYQNLGNTGFNDSAGNLTGCTGTCLTNTGLFDNLESYLYWSAVEYAPYPNGAWAFGTDGGYQYNLDKVNEFYAWAVRSGDVTASPVPVPAAFWLMASGLLGMVSLRKKR